MARPFEINNYGSTHEKGFVLQHFIGRQIRGTFQGDYVKCEGTKLGCSPVG